MLKLTYMISYRIIKKMHDYFYFLEVIMVGRLIVVDDKALEADAGVVFTPSFDDKPDCFLA